MEIASVSGTQDREQEGDLFGLNSDDEGDSSLFQTVPEADMRGVQEFQELGANDLFGGMTQEHAPAVTVDNASVTSCNSQQTPSPGRATIPSANQTGLHKRRRTTEQSDAASSKRRAGTSGHQGLSQAANDNQGK